MILKEISKPVKDKLEEFNDYFNDLMKSDVPLLNLVLKYITNKKGKQVRPVITFLAAKLCGGITQRTFTGAAMIELLHTATLIHDDVVDQANERRGVASVNAEWNNKVSVLIGDFLLSKGLLTAIDVDEFTFLKATSNAVRRMSEGELLSIETSRSLEVDEMTYFRIIADKTASLMAAGSEIGAISASSNPEDHAALKQYGEMVGTAFQIKDDIFDYTSESNLIGKPVGNDIKEKKITLPLIHALDNVSMIEKRHILKMIKRDELVKKEIKEIIEFARENGGIEYADNKANEYSQRAIEVLQPFNDSPAKESLVRFAQYVVERDK